MASLNLSINGASIKSSYAGVVNGSAPSGSSPTYGQWALFSVQAPLANAFQDSGAKESVLKVESTGEGELADLIEDFNEGRIQFAFVKVKDSNSGLPKNVLIAWCGGGVPERTKGYFTSHLSAVAKVLHGYHVQITARSDSDLEPQAIIQKVADASGAKYSAGSSQAAPSGGPPPLAKKPVFTPTTSSVGSSSFNPLVAARNRRQANVDDDGWGNDAPPVSRSEIEKVQSAYKPTKVDINALRQNKDESTGGSGNRDGVIKGVYQPIGKVDIAAIRAQAKNAHDDRPTTVKGAYEPVGKVDIAAIRAKAQKPAEPNRDEDEAPAPKSLADRSAAFSQPERLTELPKPKVAKKFGGASTFTGTKAPTPGPLGLGTPVATGGGLGSAGRTFSSAAGKTPAQLWAEKKAAQGGGAAPVSSTPSANPVTTQKSGGNEWKSGYTGKSWASVQTSNFGRGGVEQHHTGEEQEESREQRPESPVSGGGVAALKDRFKSAAPIGAGTAPTSRGVEEEHAPPPPPAASRPGVPSGGFALPGLPSRPPPVDDEEEEEREAQQHPGAAAYEEEEEEPASPIRVAAPVPRGPEPELEPAERSLPPRPVPVPEDIPAEEDLPEEEEAYDPRAAAAAVAEQSLGHAEPAPAATGGKRALIQYDYEKAEDNELELREGEYVDNIEMVDDDWWMGTNSRGESGLFPSNYVELVEDDNDAGAAAPPPPPPPAADRTPAPAPAPAPAAAVASSNGKVATAQFDYEAAEDNELSFPEGAKITNLEFPDEDWWFGHYNGASGLFPANYVELDN